MQLIGLAVVLTLSFVLTQLAGEAQGRKVVRIGILAVSLAPSGAYFTALRQGFEDLGNVESQNIELVIRSADGQPERLPELAAELIRLKVDVIVAPGNSATATAQKATTFIPTAGFVASLARPGDNITGLTIQSPDVAGKP